MIENSDRGITLNKGLAWTILVALISVVFWSGRTLSDLQNTTKALTDTLVGIKAEQQNAAIARRELETRISIAEREQTRVEVTLSMLTQEVAELKEDVRATNELIQRSFATTQEKVNGN